MNERTIFHEIISGEVNSKVVYRDHLVTAFEDIRPKSPVHILIVPNKYIKNLNSIKDTENQKVLLGHMIFICSKIAKIKKIQDTGYRLVMNCNKDAGQEIDYLHIHLVGGKPLGSFLEMKK
ncbi:HIT domain-containing protein [Candidatus Riesia pediculicola]|uniref:Hit family protein n=1 Tax=Riesia pediculicola (strain USDA) TaxID=515618 RepID=D4G8J0_RIEPU|nr:HIT domain-containing protein [Candidatus Riesia pediculicola]ADD79947.1 Hit family protein [Candidatus Riesia pediculicola USDA]ARC53869.1 purine nucleoside phosphoramidase [Candidatus Riesia pediculicola]QOJ86500.1 HIT domain-containing protein [Candidatus Riesia pediculicola]